MDEIFKNIGSKLTLSQRIERTIEGAIREEKLVVGDKLPTEREMCESFGVSRTALREALRRLSARGLIKIYSRRSSKYGAFLSQKLRGLLPSTEPMKTLLSWRRIWLSFKTAIPIIPRKRHTWIALSVFMISI
jgi:DNA-binding FadR family transcriptional regulator